MRPITIGSLFSGVGGLDLGLEWAGLGPVIWQVENNEFCQSVLERHWPDTDRTIDNAKLASIANLSSVDLICGGFPCQPFSTASHGKTVAEDLWPEMLRVINEIEPWGVIAENVSYKAIRKAVVDLEQSGYQARAFKMSASLVGAPHDRPRWFLVANSYGESESRLTVNGEVACVLDLPPSGWTHHPHSLGVDDGLPRRMDKLRALGNAVCPPVAKVVGRIFMQYAGLI